MYRTEVLASDPTTGVAARVLNVVVNAPGNRAPVFSSTPQLTVDTGTVWSYTAVAEDPDQDGVAYAVVSAPSGLEMNAGTGVATWDTIGVAPGTYTVSLQADDGRGGAAVQDFELVVSNGASNSSPTITSVPATQSLVNREWNYDVLAVDVDSDVLAYALVTGPSGMRIDDRQLTWTPSASAAGAHRVIVEVTDRRGGVVRQSFDLVVAQALVDQDLVPPVVSLGGGTADPGQTVLIPVSASDASSIAELRFYVDGVLTPIGSSGFASVTVGAAGSYKLRAVATDGAGNIARADGWIDVRESTDGVPPVVELATPLDGAEVRTPTEVTGVVTDASLSRWELDAIPASSQSAESVLLASGTSSVDGGVLGVFDPSVLAAGAWRLRLSAYDAGGYKSTVEIVVVSVNEAKYGVFSMTFADAVVPVAGMPVSVLRTYDSSARTTPGDFGYGWDLALQTLRLETDHDPGAKWSRENTGQYLPNWKLVPDASHTVTVVDGQSESIVFDFTPTLVDPVYDGRFATAEWTERTSTGATLTPLDTTELVFASGTLASLDTVQTYAPERYRLTMPDGREFTFSLEDGLTRVKDANGNQLTISDAGITSSTGTAVAFGRDNSGRITSVTTPGGLVTQYTYDGRGDLIEVTDPEGNVTTFAYDSNHYLTGIIDPLGRIPARNEYDADGRLIAIVDAAGNRTEINADPNSRTQTITDRLGNVTVQEFNARGYLTHQLFPDGTSETYTTDANGNRTSRTDGAGNTWTATYDARDNRTSVTDPLGNERTWVYDGSNRVTSATDALGRTTSIVYDARGNAISVTYPGGAQATFTYDAAGNVLTEADESGRVARHAYDALGRRTSTTSPGGDVTSYTYDADGRLLSVTDPEGGVSARTYDGRGRVTEFEDALGAATISQFDAVGQRTAYVDAAGGTTGYTYDALGRMKSSTSPTGGESTYSYDAEGRVTKTVSPDGVVRRTSYDSMGRAVTVKVDGVTMSSRTYDAAGRVKTATNATGDTTTYAYDAAGRVKSTTYADGTQVSTVYDAAGQVTSQTSPTGTVTYAYDVRGRTKAVTGVDGETSRYTYDDAGRVLTQTAADGATVTFTYDADGRLASATDPLGNAASVAYDGNGQRVAVTDPLGRERVWELDAVGRLVGYSVAGDSQLSQVFDAAGRLTSRTFGDGATTAYEYDAAGRLKRIEYPDRADAVITYSDAGRRESVTDYRGTTTYSYDARGRLTSVASPEGSIAYGYDDAGRVTSMTTPAGTTATSATSLVASSRSPTPTVASTRSRVTMPAG